MNFNSVDFNCNTLDENESAFFSDEVVYWNKMASSDDKGYNLFSDLADLSSNIAPIDTISNIESSLREAAEEFEEGMSASDSESCHSTTSDEDVVYMRPDLVFNRDIDGDTKLHTAIILERSDLAVNIINSAAHARFLSIQNKQYRQTPLHLAVILGDAKVVRRLVVGGADLTARDYKGNTAVHLACMHHTTILKELLREVDEREKSNNRYTLPFRNDDTIRVCLQTVDFHNGFTPLHVMVDQRLNKSVGDKVSMAAIDLLIKAGADVNAKEGRAGKTILHKACEKGDVSLVDYLIQVESCHVNAKTYDSDSPFDLARYRRHEEITTKLSRFALQSSDDEDMEG